MSKTMKEMSPDNTALYGPKGLLICGLSGDHADRFLSLIHALDWKDVPVGFAGIEDVKKEVGDLFEEFPDNRDPLGGIAVIAGGITQIELHQLMTAYQTVGLPNCLWAALTLNSIDWPLAKLLQHLAKEHQAMVEAHMKQKAEQGDA